METGRERDGYGSGSRIILLSNLIPLSIIKKSVCVSQESKLTLTENIRLMMTLFNNHHHTAAWVANTSRARATIRFSMGNSCAPFRIYVGPLTIRVTDHMVIDIEDDKDGEFIKRTHAKPLRKLLHFNATESHFWISLHATWEDQLVGQTYFIKVDIIDLPLNLYSELNLCSLVHIKLD